jgi:hypothetical protein
MGKFFVLALLLTSATLIGIADAQSQTVMDDLRKGTDYLREGRADLAFDNFGYAYTYAVQNNDLGGLAEVVRNYVTVGTKTNNLDSTYKRWAGDNAFHGYGYILQEAFREVRKPRDEAEFNRGLNHLTLLANFEFPDGSTLDYGDSLRNMQRDAKDEYEKHKVTNQFF